MVVGTSSAGGCEHVSQTPANERGAVNRRSTSRMSSEEAAGAGAEFGLPDESTLPKAPAAASTPNTGVATIRAPGSELGVPNVEAGSGQQFGAPEPSDGK